MTELALDADLFFVSARLSFVHFCELTKYFVSFCELIKCFVSFCELTEGFVNSFTGKPTRPLDAFRERTPHF